MKGGLDATVGKFIDSVDTPPGSVGVPSADLNVKAPGLPSAGGGLYGERRSARLNASDSLPSGGVDVTMPPASLGTPYGAGEISSRVVDTPSVTLSGKGTDVPSVGGDLSCNLPSGGDVELTEPNVEVESGGASLGAGVAADVTAAAGAFEVGVGLSGEVEKSDGNVRGGV